MKRKNTKTNVEPTERESFRHTTEDSTHFGDLNMDAVSLDKVFANESSGSADNVKELFNEDKVKARTDISSRQIKLITKAYYLAEITGMREIHKILQDFLLLSISKDRKSRLEFVEGLKARIADGINRMNDLRGSFGK